MGKFAIECPQCGKYVEAGKGFFARKKIECSCGYTINVKTDKLTSRRCPHCGNMVVFDQSKGKEAYCPVCRTPINTIEETKELAEIFCAQCGTGFVVSKSAETYECPVCDYVNNVQERIASEKLKKSGLASIIKYEGDNNTFIWKHPVEDFNYGSQLIVHESQEAIFFKDGQALDLFGPGRYTLETQQMPLLEKVYSLPTKTERTFHAEVYFINKTVQMALKWGTPEQVRFLDPLTGSPLKIGASGEMNIQVANSRKLLVKLVGTTKGISWGEDKEFTKSLQSSFRPMITNAVKTNLASAIKAQAFDILEIDEHLDVLSESLKNKIMPEFEEYGLTIPQFFITNIVLPEDDPNFQSIHALHTISLQTKMLQAQANIEAVSRKTELERQTTQTEIAKREAERKLIQAQAEAQANRIAGFTEAEVMAAKGYNQKDVFQAEVQKAYAEGIGNMGSGSSGGSGLAGDIMGLGVGMAAMGAFSPQIGQMVQGFGNMGQQPQQQPQPNVDGASWNCSCGQNGVTGNFCSNCGAKRPEPVQQTTWNCSCGQIGITGNFCSNCGKKRGE